MGNLLSASPGPTDAEQQRVLAGANDPLFLDEVKAEPAVWSDEGICRRIQRFLGLLPDSPAEVLKQTQQYPVFTQRPISFVFDVGDRLDSVVRIQQLYRRYRWLQMWHEVGGHMLELARSRLAEQRVLEEEEMSAASFRRLLAEGFSANKVSISGALKTVQIRLERNLDAEEYYLTWKPSRKRKPRINLHDVKQVSPVLKEGNELAARLTSKVSHRRGLVIRCKSHHRGRVVLELGSKRERDLLLRGFERLLAEMNWDEPALDNAGVLRKQLPRRQSVLHFFGAADGPQDSPGVGTGNQLPSNDASSVDPPQEDTSVHGSRPASQMESSSGGLNGSEARDTPFLADPARVDPKTIEHFYRTRFDDPAENSTSQPLASTRAAKVTN